MSGRNLKVNLVANTSQFKSAMSETSNQIKLLNSEFKSASAETDQYGNKLDQTSAKKKQLSGVIQQYTQRVKSIKEEQKHWTRELEKGNITEEEHAQKQQELARRLNNTEAEMKRYEGQLKKLNSEGKKTRMTFDEFDKKFRDVGRTMRNVGAQVGITAGVGFMAMKRVLGDVVNEAISFESQMSEVQAISGATGSEIEKLTNQSKDLGRQTKYTAQEVAESQANLARAGFNTNEIYEAMPGLLDLAASSNLELGNAANITSNIIRTFGFEAKEAGRVADVLAKGAATANTDVAGLGQAMEVAGPVANSLDIALEQVAASAGIMADAGIDGSKSGRMLRQGMLRLAKPTGAAAKELEKMKVEAFDADGNMKSLDKVVAELEKGLKGQTKQQKAAALATIFGSESTAGWTVLLDKGSDELAEYTKELENSEGAAADMAETMQDNAEGAIIRMQSALSGLKIELGEKLLPTLGKGADLIGDFANNLAEMDEATIQTIAETALLVTAVLGVTTAVAGVVAGLGAFMALAGPIGLAIAGGTLLLGGLGAAMYKNNLETEKLNEVNLDSANSLADQAVELEKNVDTFDRLSDKAKISNDELALLYDLNKRIGEGGSSEEIAKLQSQYDKLAEKSGLSKDELQELFGANENIINQHPEVDKVISENGNAWAENTEKIREYIDGLYEASRAELEREREKQLKNEVELQSELNDKQRQYNSSVEALELADDIRKMNQEELFDLQADITDKMNETVQGSEEWLGLNDLLTVTNAALNGQAEEHYEKQGEITEEKRNALNTTQEELDEVQAMNGALGDVWLKQAGITKEGEEGLISLEKQLVKNDEKLAKLDQEQEKNGQLTTKQKEQYAELVASNEELSYTQDYLNNELGLYGSVNTLVESKRHLLSDSTNEKIKELEKTHEIEVTEGNILTQIQEKQGLLVEERDQLEENRQKQGANKEEIDKQIASIDKKLGKGDEAIAQILHELDVLDLVKDGIELNSTELETFLVGLGYTVDEAAELAAVLVGDTLAEMEDGAEKGYEAGENTGVRYSDGIISTESDTRERGGRLTRSILDELGKGDNEADLSGKSKGESHNKGFSSTLQLNRLSSYGLTNTILGELGKGDKEANTSGKSKGDSHNKGLTSTERINKLTAIGLTNSMLTELGKGNSTSQNHGKSKGTSFNSGLSGTRGTNQSTASSLVSGVTTRLGRGSDGGGGARAGSMFSGGLRKYTNSARTSGSSVASSGERGLRSVSTASAGSNFVSGFSGAISSRSGVGSSIWNVASSLGRTALSALNSSIRTASPSKETEQSGNWFGEGFIGGIEQEEKGAVQQAVALAKNTLGAFDHEMDKFKEDFGKVAFALEDNKQVLKVEHTLDGKFDEFSSLLRQSNDKESAYVKDLLNATLQQNNILMQILAKNPNLVINDRLLAEEIEPTVTEIQDRNNKIKTDFSSNRL